MTRKQRKNRNRILLAGVLLLAAFLAERLIGGELPPWALLLFYLPSYLTVGYDVLRGAVRNVVHGQVFDEKFLMTLATLGALAIGFLPDASPEFAEATFVMLFYQVGELFQSIAVGKSRRSIAALMDIRPDSARVVRNGEETEVSPEAVSVGEEIVIRPGDRVPLDGRIRRGCSELDTAALTGESLPRAVAEGDEVISGCTNLTGLLYVKVSKPYGESTVARILSLIETAGEKKAKSESFITRFARFYTPFVVICALVLAILPPLLSGNFAGTFSLWLVRALTFLVVSCPCALVISVPLSFFGGIGGAAREGILIKGSVYLETLARAQVAVFDKTGTLTCGSFAVCEIHPITVSENELLMLAARAEFASNHPIAAAIRNAAGDAALPPDAVRELAGRGVIAEIDGATVAVGNLALMKEQGVAVTAESRGRTEILVARDGRFLGSLTVADAVKGTAREAIAALGDCGIRRTVMLTGDRQGAAAAVAAELGIGEWRSELLPAEKVAAVEGLLDETRRGALLFVGDGINDAPVLARADVGIAMGALGADAAIEAADVVLMDDDPRRIATAIRHARRTVRIVHQNIGLALGVKGAVLLGSALGLLGALQMPLAIFADVGVAMLAICNAMRAMRVK